MKALMLCLLLLTSISVNAEVASWYNLDGRKTASGEVFRRLVLECRIKKINERMEYIDKAMPVLNDFEKQVVDYLKQGYKMSRIAVLLKCPRRKITYTRDAAISKIMQYTEQNH